MTSDKLEVPEGFYTKMIRGQIALQCATCKRNFNTDRLRVVANIEWLRDHAVACKRSQHELEVAKFLLHSPPDD